MNVMADKPTSEVSIPLYSAPEIFEKEPWPSSKAWFWLIAVADVMVLLGSTYWLNN